MTAVKYIKSCVFEFVMCLAMAFGFSTVIFNGFYVDSSLAHDYLLTICVSGVLLAVLFAGAYNKRSILIAIATFIAAAAGALVYSRLYIGNVFRDSEDNPYFYYILLILSVLGIFLLSRTKTGTGVLFTGGAFVIAMIEFMYESEALMPTIVFLLSCGTCFVYKNYQRNVLTSQTVRTDFARAFIISTAVCIIVTGVGSAVFYSIIKPMEPQTRELKLITKYMSLQTLQKIGVADIEAIPDYEQQTDNESDDKRTAEGNKDKDQIQHGSDKNKDEDPNMKNTPDRLDNSNNPFFYVVSYLKKSHLWAWGLLLLILLIAGAIALKLYTRRKWLRDLEKKTHEDRIKSMYSFYMRKLPRMGIVRQPADTLFQFAERAENQLNAFSAGDVSFAQLTDTYVRVVYGKCPVSNRELNEYLIFQNMFYRNCRTYLGKFKYIVKFFIL